VAAFRVAFVQGCPRFGAVHENLERGLDLAHAVEADLVVLPELWASGYAFLSAAEVARLAEDAAQGPTAQALRVEARRRGIHFVCGFAERARGRFYNSALLVGPRGVKAVYRKAHLFERECLFFSPGDMPFAVHRVGRARVGMLICFDWRFPESARVLALLGADLIVHPSNLVFPQAQVAMRTRALENRVFVATANRTGSDRRPGLRIAFTGRSQVVDPDGRVLVGAGVREQVARAADCLLAHARRKRLTPLTPIFSNRRPELYGALVRPTGPRGATRGER
jgi:predicted amidohydrolase